MSTLSANSPEKPISFGFLNMVHTDPWATAFFKRLLDIAKDQSPGKARTLLYAESEDEEVRTTIERAFNDKIYGGEEPKMRDSQAAPSNVNVYGHTKKILDSGLGHLMMSRLASDCPQEPPFEVEFWVQSQEDDSTKVIARWIEGTDSRSYRMMGLHAVRGMPFGHSGHDPLSEEHMSLVDELARQTSS